MARMNAVGRLVGAPLLAVEFLTVLPVPVPRAARDMSMGWVFACFPLAGAAMGLALFGLDRALAAAFPPGVAAALVVAALLALTGALHLDGLMDSFDGLFGGKDPTSRLAIMKDSRVGSFGIAAAAAIVLLEYASLASIAAANRLPALVLALALSRWAMALLLWAFPAATSRGLAASLKPHVRWHHVGLASLVAVAVAVYFGWEGVAMACGACLITLAVGAFATSRIGGITGDSCGAVNMLVEAALLVGASAWA